MSRCSRGRYTGSATAMATDRSIKIGSPIVVHQNAPDTIQYAGGSLHFICEAINPWLDRPLAQRGREPADVNVAPTCGLLLDREAAIDVGLFDERYFIGKEDGDFTHRIRVAGYRIAEPAEALLLHRSRPRGSWLFYFQIRNRWHFMLKNYEWLTLLLILPCLLDLRAAAVGRPPPEGARPHLLAGRGRAAGDAAGLWARSRTGAPDPTAPRPGPADDGAIDCARRPCGHRSGQVRQAPVRRVHEQVLGLLRRTVLSS